MTVFVRDFRGRRITHSKTLYLQKFASRKLKIQVDATMNLPSGESGSPFHSIRVVNLGQGKCDNLPRICAVIVMLVICLAGSSSFQATVYPKLPIEQSTAYSLSKESIGRVACNEMLKNNKKIVLNANPNDVTAMEGTYGRLGNRIISMRQAISSAIDQGCHILLPQVLDG